MSAIVALDYGNKKLILSDEVLLDWAGTVADRLDTLESEYGIDNETAIRLVTGVKHLPIDMALFAFDTLNSLCEPAWMRMAEEEAYDADYVSAAPDEY